MQLNKTDNLEPQEKIETPEELLETDGTDDNEENTESRDFITIKLGRAFRYLSNPEELECADWRSIIAAFSRNLSEHNFSIELQAEIMFGFLNYGYVSAERLNKIIDQSLDFPVRELERELISEFAFRYYDLRNKKYRLNPIKVRVDINKRGIEEIASKSD
jgi:hypothetical protein